MKARNAIDRLVTVEKTGDMDYKQRACDYVRRACLLVAEHIEDYMPDKVYTDCPGEVVIRLPLDGAATIEVSTDTYVLRDE